ncbi:MAG: hypothetical protein GY737_20435 [Desulfobacteraceae bacterium]|nr:hypothetical protein [Desulfobacteraceae bacterium]
MEKYYTGFDIGTDCVHAVVMNSAWEIVSSPKSLMHFGNPADSLKEVYDDIIVQYGFENIITTAFTGSGGEYFANILGVPFFHDTITIPAGIGIIAPDADYIFHIGARDPYYFEREQFVSRGEARSFVSDHATGTKCGGGSGILITRQCRRFFESEFPVRLGTCKRTNRGILQEQLGKIFRKTGETISASTKEIDVGGRCGVVIQSDMIHLQNRGEEISNILCGLFERIIKNYASDVLKTRRFDDGKKAVVSGGVFENAHLVKMLEKKLAMEISVPRDFKKSGAVGAVVKARHQTGKFNSEDLLSIAQAEKATVKTTSPLNQGLEQVRIYNEAKPVARHGDLILYKMADREKREVILGIDGGSTTTKAIVADASSLDMIAEICLYTNGKPLQTVLDIFRQLRECAGDRLTIRAVAYTGSSGAFYHKLFTDTSRNPDTGGIDLVKDEITCHALGVKHFNHKVDTIFELGGQDAKFTLFNGDGTVKKSKMNLSCMAGTGQTMQNMIEMIGLDIGTSFHEYALKAEKTPLVDDTCGVFTEAGIARLIALGFPKEEIAAAIAYGFMGGYVNKFIGNETFGAFASAQGGPFNGKACLAALALHTGMEVHAFPHRQLFGAQGAVIAAYNEIREFEKQGIAFESKFRGLDLADARFSKSEKRCSTVIPDSCTLKDCKLEVYKVDDDYIYSGGACPKGNTDTCDRKAPDYVSRYKKRLRKHLARYTVDLECEPHNQRVLIPRSLTFLNEKGVFYAALYHALGFDVAVSPESDDAIVDLGVHYSHSETCFPVKLAHGHAAFLKKHLRAGRDKILLVNAIGSGLKQKRFCPYVAGGGFLAKDAVGIDNRDALLPVIYFNDPAHGIEKALLSDLTRVYGSRFTIKDVKRAVIKAQKAQETFLAEIYQLGDKIVRNLTKKGEKIFIGIGRGYTLLDNKASSSIHDLFASYGLHFIPSFFLRPPDYAIDDIAENMYWFQGEMIIRYTLETALRFNYFPVRATNFNCGTDSILLYHEEYLTNIAEKPHLVLQTDGHSSNAQFGTRTLANYEVVKKHKPRMLRLDAFRKPGPRLVLENKLIGIPYLGDNAHILSATFKAIGLKSEVMPTQTKAARAISKKIVGTNTCVPFSFQVGDSIAWLHSLGERGFDPQKDAVIFQPMAQGPCRFGQYHVLLKQIFRENGLGSVDIFSPDADRDYTNVPLTEAEIVRQAMALFKGTCCLDILGNALLRTRPYEKEKGSAREMYELLTARLYEMIGRNARAREIVPFMAESKDKFEALLDPGIKRKPIVIVNGEIFVRLHEKANQHSILLLEKYGLETKLAPISQWIEYTNKTAIREFKRSLDWKKYFFARLKKSYMQNRGKKLYAPFQQYLEGRKCHESDDIISHIQNALVYDKHIQGESPISIGEAYMFTKGRMPEVSGIYHVGPFGCMQETAATSQIQSITQQHRESAVTIHDRIIPFMDAVFGDSELPNLEAEIAVFAEKCYLKQELNNK